MTKKSFHFWILLVASLFLTTLIISYAFKVMQGALYLLLLLIFILIIYMILKSLTGSDKLADRSEKLKRRD